ARATSAAASRATGGRPDARRGGRPARRRAARPASAPSRRSCRARRPDQAELLEQLQDPLRAPFRLLVLGLDPDLRQLGRLVRVGDAGELLDLAPERLLVEALHVAARTLLHRRVDEDLDERPARRDHLPRLLPRLAVGRDGGDDHRRAVTREPGRDPADAVDVPVAVLLREAEPIRQVLAHLVAVEPFDQLPAAFELRAYELGDGRLPGTRKAGEPERKAAAVGGGLELSSAKRTGGGGLGGPGGSPSWHRAILSHCSP